MPDVKEARVAKQGEIDYLKNLDEAEVRHAVNKPFSDDACEVLLMEIGAVMALLPRPPARVLDIGCGAGWTSLFLARRGYEVVGLDISADMVAHAEACRSRWELDNVRFEAGDYETVRFEAEFDAALFFDSLHHAIDERAALEMAFRALKRDGRCVASEPGVGHAEAEVSIQAREKYDVTEKDMPPWRIIEIGRQVGFRTFRTYPHCHQVRWALFSDQPGRWFGWLGQRWGLFRRLASIGSISKIRFLSEPGNGITVLWK
jgi:SAM-dependent methyltransferase